MQFTKCLCIISKKASRATRMVAILPSKIWKYINEEKGGERDDKERNETWRGKKAKLKSF